MLTTQDIKRMTEVFATKEELKQAVENLATKDDFRQVMDKVDAVYGELRGIREDTITHRQEHDDINEQFEEIRSSPTIALELKQKSPQKPKI